MACGVLRLELEQVLQQIKAEGLFDCEITATYLQAGLHVDFDRLKDAIVCALESLTADRIILLYGSKCHPEFHEFLSDRLLTTFHQSNCIELILGVRMQEIDRLTKTFYLTPGWLLCWQEFFEQSMRWDEVDMRQSLGYYDRMLLADTGVCEITDEQILEFFERTRVPIVVDQTGLAVFKSNIVTAIERALANDRG